MLKIVCDACQRPIEPGKDNYFDLPNLTIINGGRAGRAGNLHFCSKSCFCTWLSKNGELSNLVLPGQAQ